MFTIKSIKIYPECQHLKNLHPGFYELGETEDKDFFGKNISLHALVGKNGSGKSALLDLVLRMTNNVGAIMCKKQDRNAAEPLFYVNGIYADLAYCKTDENDVLHQGKLSIRDGAVWITYDNKPYWMSDINLYVHADDKSKYYKEIDTILPLAENWDDLNDTVELQHIADCFFYTIATNYSMLGFQANDYKDEDSLEYGYGYLDIGDNSHITTEYDENLKIRTWFERKNWISNLFHKNDGYLCPVVLNPYRSEGTIDTDKEYELTSNRLSSLLLSMEGSSKYLLEDYRLDYLEYEIDKDFYKRFKPRFKSKKDKQSLLENGGDLRLFAEKALVMDSYADIILNALHLEYHEDLSDIETMARLYLVYKILNIAHKYPSYREYKDLGDINNVFEMTDTDDQRVMLEKLTKEVIGNNSHIEQKVHQTIQFIKRIEYAKLEKFGEYDITWMNDKFIYSDYRKYFNIQETFDKLDDYMPVMPPNFFKQTIYLKKLEVDGGKENWKGGIPFSKMSSGEKQFLYQVTTLVYHLMNLKSVSDNTIKYHDVNIILDEIEVCFHPDYQRQFVNKLLALLTDGININEVFGIHIWLTTHSPFVLSDIPSEYIISLSNGKIDKERSIGKTFCANVYELLHSKFFMDEYIGDFAKGKLDELINIITDKNIQKTGYLRKNYDDLVRRIEMIGDDFIRVKLKEQLDERSLCPNELQEQLEKAKAKVAELEDMLKRRNLKEYNRYDQN